MSCDDQLATTLPTDDSAPTSEQALARQHLPRIEFDRHEPFLPCAVGYTVFRETAPSSSFKRTITLDGAVRIVIEYAIWWDWDIQHLYELEHVWVHLDQNEQVVFVEASAHGKCLAMMVDDEPSVLVDGRVVLFSEPGKHAFAPNETWLHNIKDYTRVACGENAGAGGLLVNDLFRDALDPPSALDHRLVRRWLQHHAFAPAYEFSQSLDLRDLPLVSWPMLKGWIPERLHVWINELRAAPHLRVICLDCGDTLIDEGTEIKDAHQVAQSADLIPGADELIHELKRQGYTLALVADGPRGTFENLLQQHGLWDSFDTVAISGDVGVLKPDAVMFHTALNALSISQTDYNQVVMVGNYLARDIKGANQLKIISVWLDWAPRRSKTPADETEVPDYTIKLPLDLLAVLDEIELKLTDTKTS